MPNLSNLKADDDAKLDAVLQELLDDIVRLMQSKKWRRARRKIKRMTGRG